MNPKTKLYKIMKEIYTADGKISSVEIGQKTGFGTGCITAFTNRLSDWIKKEKINGRVYYWLPEYNRKSIKKYLKDEN